MGALHTTQQLLPGEAHVVRGGKASAQQLVNGCSRHQGVFGFSVQSGAEQTPAQLAAAGKFPNQKMSTTTVLRIRAQGYDVVVTPGAGYHATVVVPEPWNEEQARTLVAEFQVELNPFPRSVL
jgi:hypothetical protein